METLSLPPEQNMQVFILLTTITLSNMSYDHLFSIPDILLEEIAPCPPNKR